MQYRLRSLMIVLALGPPIIAALWLYGRVLEAVLVTVCVFGAIPSLFALWYWMLCRSQADSKMRGKPNYDPPIPYSG
jgi:hypothetical protein